MGPGHEVSSPEELWEICKCVRHYPHYLTVNLRVALAVEPCTEIPPKPLSSF
uniref:Uncharacterized protein n=1 Tax=Anguilla anguilla TaxID=7936 RepID=A0A0E9XE21_ANGAN